MAFHIFTEKGGTFCGSVTAFEEKDNSVTFAYRYPDGSDEWIGKFTGSWERGSYVGTWEEVYQGAKPRTLRGSAVLARTETNGRTLLLGTWRLTGRSRDERWTVEVASST